MSGVRASPSRAGTFLGPGGWQWGLRASGTSLGRGTGQGWDGQDADPEVFGSEEQKQLIHGCCTSGLMLCTITPLQKVIMSSVKVFSLPPGFSQAHAALR